MPTNHPLPEAVREMAATVAADIAESVGTARRLAESLEKIMRAAPHGDPIEAETLAAARIYNAMSTAAASLTPAMIAAMLYRDNRQTEDAAAEQRRAG